MKKRIIGIAAAIILAGTCLITTSSFAVELGGVDIHGFISQGFIMSDEYNYLTHNSKDGSFEYNEVGINFSKELTEQLRLGIQLFSRDIGDAGNNKVTIDWAYGDYRVKDWLGFRAGRIKLPLGLYNETRDIDLLRTNIVMPQSIYPDLLRDTVIAANGGSLYGTIDLSSAGTLEYQAIAGQVNIDNDSGFEKYFEHRTGSVVTGDSDSDITYSGALRWNTPLEGLIIGVSALQSTVDTPMDADFGTFSFSGNTESENTFYTASIEYTWGNLVIATEYQRYEADSIVSASGFGTVLENSVTSEGYYLSASYRFTDLFSLGAYYSVFYEDKNDKDGNNLDVKSDAWEKDFALSLRFDINEYMIFKIEGHMVNGTARVIRADDNSGTDENFTYGVAKVTFSF